jgi:Cys-rich repeat protein
MMGAHRVVFSLRSSEPQAPEDLKMRVRPIFKILTFSLALGLIGCGSSTSESTGGTGGGVAGAAGGSVGGGGGGGGSTSSSSAASNGPTGLFDIHYIGTSSYTDVSGLMYDGPTADLVVWEKKKTDGDCSLYTPRSPFCESCPDGQVCVDTNVCRKQPATHSVGDVTLTGLNPPSGASSLKLTVGGNNAYLCAETLPVPPCTAGGTIGLSATGDGSYPAFSIQTQCIAPLALTTKSVTLESGQPFTLTWTPGSVASARITLEFDLSHHGGSKGQLRCDTADSGSVTVSAALIKSLLDLGVTGFPWLTVTRVVKGTAAVGSGQAQLSVYSDFRYDDMEIAGLKSCSDDSQCQSGQTCLIPSYMCGVACTTNTDCPSGQTCQTSTKVCK